MLRLLFAVFVLVETLAAASPPTFAESNGGKIDNVAATRVFLHAWHKLMLAGEHDQPVGETAVQSLVAGVKTDCPNVLADAPENHAREDIRDEIVEEVPLMLERPALNATLAFASTVERLRWSDRKLTYYVTHSAREEAAKEKVNLPDICADANALAADGFKVTPPTTEKFLTDCGAANTVTMIESRPGETEGLEERIWRLLRPYERPEEKRLIPHEPTRREIERAEVILEKDIGKPVVEIAHSLGLAE